MNKSYYLPGRISPCKDCKLRSFACHDKCEKYKTWSAKIRKTNTNRKNFETMNYMQYDID